MGNHKGWIVMTRVERGDWPEIDGPYATELDAMKRVDEINAVRSRYGWRPAEHHIEKFEIQTFTTVNYRYSNGG